MRRSRLLVALPLLAGLSFYAPSHAAAAGFGPHGARGSTQTVHALPFVNSLTSYFAYDIEAYGYYCGQTAPTSCFARYNNGTYTYSPDLMYAEADAYGQPGQAGGHPAGVFFECDKYVEDNSGNLRDYYEYVDVSAPGFPQRDAGIISSSSYATLGPRFFGENVNASNAFGQINADVYDSDTATHAVVTGINYANQFTAPDGSNEDLISTNLPNPGYTIRMTGTLYLNNDNNVAQTNATIQCVAGGHTMAISNPVGTVDSAGYPSQQSAENEYEEYFPVM